MACALRKMKQFQQEKCLRGVYRATLGSSSLRHPYLGLLRTGLRLLSTACVLQTAAMAAAAVRIRTVRYLGLASLQVSYAFATPSSGLHACMQPWIGQYRRAPYGFGSDVKLCRPLVIVESRETPS